MALDSQIEVEVTQSNTNIEVTNNTAPINIEVGAVGIQGPPGTGSSTASLSGDYYLNSNPSGFLNTLSGLSVSYVTGISGIINDKISVTGSILNDYIISLSGKLVETGNSLQSQVVSLTNNLQTTGSSNYGYIIGLSGKIIETGTNLQSQLNVVTVNIQSTGSSLYNTITGLSGDLVNTGNNLYSQILGLSGTITLSGFITGLNSYEKILFVNPTGNDSLAIKGRFDRPYQSVLTAKNAASANDTIFVYPGNYYINTSLLKDGVNWYFLNGAKIYGTGAATTQPILSDTIVSTSSKIISDIDGYGEFYSTGSFPLSNNNGILCIKHPQSKIKIKGKILENQGGNGNTLYTQSGNLHASFESILVNGNFAAVHYAGGENIYIEANLISGSTATSAGIGLIGAPTSNADQDFHLKAKDVVGGWGIYSSTHNAKLRYLLDIDRISATSNDSLIYIDDSPAEFYIKNKILNCTNQITTHPHHIHVGAGAKLVLESDHIYAGTGTLFHNNDGNINIHIKNIEEIGNLDRYFLLQGGSGTIIVDRINGKSTSATANYCAFEYQGGDYLIKDTFVDFTNITGASVNPIKISASGLKLQNVTLLYGGTGYSINTSSESANYSLTGFGLYSNRPANPSLTVHNFPYFSTTGQYYSLNNPSGFLNTLSGLSVSYVQNVSGELNTKINSLSGYSNTTFSTIVNLATTGQQAINYSNSNSTNLSGNLQVTGSTLDNKISSLSGYSNTTFATVVNLETTGSNLNNRLVVQENLSKITGVSISGSESLTGLFNISGGTNISLSLGTNNNLIISSVGGSSINSPLVTGLGTVNYIPKFSNDGSGLVNTSVYTSGNKFYLTGNIGINTPADNYAFLTMGNSGILFEGQFGPVLQYTAVRNGMLQFTRKDIQTLGRNYILLGYDGTNSAIQFTSQGLVGWSNSTTTAAGPDTSIVRFQSGTLQFNRNIWATGITGNSIHTNELHLIPTGHSGSILNLGNNSFYIHTGYSNDTWILPLAAASPGHIYFIKNKGASFLLTGNSSTERIYSSSEVLSMTVPSGDAYILASDAINSWMVM